MKLYMESGIFRESINNRPKRRDSRTQIGSPDTEQEPQYLTFTDTKSRRPCRRWRDQTPFPLTRRIPRGLRAIVFFARYIAIYWSCVLFAFSFSAILIAVKNKFSPKKNPINPTKWHKHAKSKRKPQSKKKA